MPISESIPVEVLLEEHLAAADWLLKRGIVCLRCGEPFWGSLGELLGNRGYDEESIAAIIDELNEYLESVEG